MQNKPEIGTKQAAGDLGGALSHLEKTRTGTLGLRSAFTGGTLGLQPGERTAGEGSPVFGAGLRAPGDALRAAKVFSGISEAVTFLAGQAKARKLSTAQLERALEMQPHPAEAADEALWTDEGAGLRAELRAAYGALAEVAPDAIAEPKFGYTTVETVLMMDMNEAQLQADDATLRANALQFVERLPKSAFAPAARNVAGLPAPAPAQAKLPFSAGRYDLPGGGQLYVGKGNDLMFDPSNLPLYEASIEGLERQGFELAGETGMLTFPRGPDAAWPMWKAGAWDIGADASLFLRAHDVMIEPGGRADGLEAQGFTWQGESRMLSPPKGADGAYVPGEYALPGGGRLWVGRGNDVMLDPSNMAGGYRRADALAQDGFRWAGDSGLLSLPKGD